MNSKSINLLIPEKNDTLLAKRIFLLRNISLFILTLVIISAVSLFFLILTSPLPELRSQEASTQQKLQQLKETSNKYYVVRERLAAISTIISQRTKLEPFIFAVQQNLPSDAQITQIRAKDTEFSVTVSSSSLLSINTFIETMYVLKREEQLFASVTLSQLRFDQETGGYAVELTTALPI